ncbi:MAG: hypothetical protein JWO38_7539 [Gemmataceae bacterium]|nr:hypothetical protein [Gemmataceae bacterium]
MWQSARVVGGAVLVLLGMTPVVRADGEKVPLDQLPKAVTEALKKRFPKAELVEATKETEGAKTTEYDVTVKENGKTIDVTLTPEGLITQLVKEIAAKDLPKTVAAALAKKFPKATFKSYEQVVSVKDGKETTDHYEVELETAGNKTIEIEITPDGKITSMEEKKE